MRSSSGVRGLRTAQLTVILLALAAPASALAALAGPRTGEDIPAPTTRLAARFSRHHVPLGGLVVVSGRAARHPAGAVVTLLAARPRGAWRTLTRTRVGGHGGWSVRVHLRESTRLRTVEAVPARVDPASAALAAHAGAATSAAFVRRTAAASRASLVRVSARLSVAARARVVFGAATATLSGFLAPARAGREVLVQARTGRRWRTLGRARTGVHGAFAARVAAVAGPSRRLRVRFAGDVLNAATQQGAGSLTAFTPALVSWYDDAGETACGFHATYGVANRTLPCGTHVLMRAGGRSVMATVDDRGPYVYPRTYDLDQSTAAALGFAGVGVVQTSVQ